MKQNRTTAFLPFLKPGYILAGAAAIILGALSLISLENYLLFHGVVEIVTIAIAFSIFILVWNNRGIITDTFFLIIGISFLFTGSLDLVHTLAYKGMGVFPGSTADLPTQLWIAARYFQSIAFLVATLFIGKSITKDRKYDTAIIFAGCTAVCGILLASIFVWQDFPPCFIEGTGLTPFKIVSEYIISLILIATVVILYTRRRFFDPEVWGFLVAAQVFLVLGELAFTTYASVYGFTNMLGHLFKLISFYLFYRAIVVVGITRPYDLLFRDLVENINDVIFTMDRQGRIVYISPVISRQFGYNPDTVNGQEFIQLVHPEDRSRFDAWFNKSMKGGYNENEFRIRTHDGRERSVRTSICPVMQVSRGGMFTCTLTDITERKQAELALRESEEKFRSLVEYNPYGVLLTRPGGPILLANAAACKLFGRTEEEILALGRPGLVDPHDPRVAAAVAEREKEGAAIAREMTFIRKDGSRFEGEVSSTIFLDRNGQPMTSMIISDITERRRIENALQLARSKINLLNTVTFQDIQSSAFSVAAFHLLLGSLVTDEKAKNYLEKLAAINRKIVDSLNFAKNYEDLGTKPPYWQNIQQVFLFAISHLDFLKIRRNSQVEGLEIYADPLLETVFFHMMQNVLIHGQHATEVTLRYQVQPDHLVLFIEDNGVGIPADEKQMIFDRRYGKNTGLGLFLVREVLSITGMTIRETGEPGQGARFEILVPREGYRFTTGQKPL